MTEQNAEPDAIGLLSYGDLKHGFTFADVKRLTMTSLKYARSHSLDSDDRYEAAYFAICELLYTHTGIPNEWDLIDAGRNAVDRETRDWLREHGSRKDGTNSGAAFAKFWVNQPHRFPEDWICDRMALPVVLARLTRTEIEALTTLAALGDMSAAAEALGVPYQTMTSRVARARERFMVLWFGQEGLPPKAGRGTCKAGHDRDIYGRQRADGKWRCNKCRRDYRARRRAKGEPC